jgi:hypothetical protein
MTTDPLITAALLGTARVQTLPPAPDPTLDAEWQAIPLESAAAALLHALALTRALHRAGTKSQASSAIRHSTLPTGNPRAPPSRRRRCRAPTPLR